MKIAAIIVAAGVGRRAGGAVPKQLALVAGQPLAAWSIDVFAQSPDIETTILVVPSGQRAAYMTLLPSAKHHVEGGLTRTASVLAGLEAALELGCTHVLVHDAARAGLTQETVTALVDALTTHDAAAPALPVVDALKRRLGDGLRTMDRAELFRVQTPQAFRLETLYAALSETGESFVDDLAGLESREVPVKLVAGDENLFKVTHPEDFDRMERLLSGSPHPRIGTGFDVHAFEPGDHVTLCGIEIAHEARLAGHSDADVAWHALTDAIFGALGAGDIGDHFPPSEPQWKGAPSRIFLEKSVAVAREAGFEIGNCDLTIICEAPKVKPHREAMRQATAHVLGTSLDHISVKATTTEQLGFTGRKEGIAAQAAVLLVPCQLSR